MKPGYVFTKGEEVVFTPQPDFQSCIERAGQRCRILHKVKDPPSGYDDKDTLIYVVFKDGKRLELFGKRLSCVNEIEVSGEV